MNNKVYWITKDGRKIDIDTWDDLNHMRNVLKMLIREKEFEPYEQLSWGDLNDDWGDRD